MCPPWADFFDAFDHEKEGYACVPNSEAQIAKGRGKYICACCDQRGGGVFSNAMYSWVHYAADCYDENGETEWDLEIW